MCLSFCLCLRLRWDGAGTFLPAPRWTRTSPTPTSSTFTSAVTLGSRQGNRRPVSHGSVHPSPLYSVLPCSPFFSPTLSVSSFLCFFVFLSSCFSFVHPYLSLSHFNLSLCALSLSLSHPSLSLCALSLSSFISPLSLSLSYISISIFRYRYIYIYILT